MRVAGPDERPVERADDRVFVQCFEADEIHRLRVELKTRLPLIQLLSYRPDANEVAEHSRVADGLGVSLNAVVKNTDDGPAVTDLARDVHERAMLLHVWTVRADRLPAYAESTDQLLDLLVKEGGADGIFTDHPDVVLQYRRYLEDRPSRPGTFHLLRNRSPE